MNGENVLVMPENYVLLDDEEMTYLDGGATGYAKTAEERAIVAGSIALAASSFATMTYKVFAKTAAASCSTVLLFIGSVSMAALGAVTIWEGTWAAIAAGYVAKKKNFGYKYYGFGNGTIYTKIWKL